MHSSSIISRNRHRRPRALTLGLGLLLAALPSIVVACNVPVFRYALEHWHPDSYRGVLFHRGPLPSDAVQRLDALRASAGAGRLNLQLRTVDLNSTVDPADQMLLGEQANGPLPRLVIQYPENLQLDHPVWSGPFADRELSLLADSPARREVLRRLAAGQTAVWLMIDGGDPAKDQESDEKLNLELDRLATSLELPKLTDSPEDAILDGPELRVEFSSIRISRKDPEEQGLVALLVGCEPDLASLNEPLVFPIFGRGRVMLPLVGAGVSAQNIRNSAEFLSGACSCQVKELNPGFDLLFSTSWTELLPWLKWPSTESTTSSSPPLETSQPEMVAIPTGSAVSVSNDQLNSSPPAASSPIAAANGPSSTPPQSPGTGTRTTLAIAGGVLVVVALILALVRRPPG